jgi:cyclopropane fatty-acyl-phospholipid synthase-like methyltransferase
MTSDQTREPQYRRIIEIRDERGLTPLGPMMNQVWQDDPRRLAFVLARYKFVAKMLSGKQRALEVGCGDAFGTRIVRQEVPYVCAVDFDPFFVKDVNSRMEAQWQFDCKVHDILSGPVEGGFDAAYSLDVIEHIQQTDEDKYVYNIARSLQRDGVLIVGTPSIQSQAYASPPSKEGHVNCKDQRELKALLLKYFDNVFSFGMNDEVVHTGYHAMAHYLFAVCAGNKTA